MTFIYADGGYPTEASGLSALKGAGAKARSPLIALVGPTKVVPLLQDMRPRGFSAACNARVQPRALAARLKSCPVTRQGISHGRATHLFAGTIGTICATGGYPTQAELGWGTQIKVEGVPIDADAA